MKDKDDKIVEEDMKIIEETRQEVRIGGLRGWILRKIAGQDVKRAVYETEVEKK